MIMNNTYCGCCGHKGMKREVRKNEWANRKDVIYSCLNPDCDSVEGICFEFAGECAKDTSNSPDTMCEKGVKKNNEWN